MGSLSMYSSDIFIVTSFDYGFLLFNLSLLLMMELLIYLTNLSYRIKMISDSKPSRLLGLLWGHLMLTHR